MTNVLMLGAMLIIGLSVGWTGGFEAGKEARNAELRAAVCQVSPALCALARQ